MNVRDRRQSLDTEQDLELEAEAPAPGRRMRTDALQRPTAQASTPAKDAPTAPAGIHEASARLADAPEPPRARTVWDVASPATAEARAEATTGVSIEASSSEAAAKADEHATAAAEVETEGKAAAKSVAAATSAGPATAASVAPEAAAKAGAASVAPEASEAVGPATAVSVASEAAKARAASVEPAMSKAAKAGATSVANVESKAAARAEATGVASVEPAMSEAAAKATVAPEASEAAAKAGPEAAEASVEPAVSASEAAANEAWLADAQAAFATAKPEIHTCDSGCVHSQLSRIMAGYAEALPKIDQNHVDIAVKRARDKKKVAGHDAAGQDAKGSKPTAGPAAPPASPEPAGGAPPAAPAPEAPAPEAGHSAAYSGSVTDAKPAGFPGIMGLTTWDLSTFTFPDLQLKVEQANFTEDMIPEKTWVAQVQKTTSAEANTPAIATPVGTYAVSQLIPIQIKNDAGAVIKTEYWKQSIQVDAAANAQIRAAEQEHVDDISQAYKITLKAAEDAVNKQVGEYFGDKDKNKAIKQAKDAVKAALDPKLTENPATWRAMMQTCANLTKSGRDKSNWHTFNFGPVSDADYDADAKSVVSHVQNNPNVGTTSSAALIKL